MMRNIDRVLKSRDDADKGPYSWGYILPSGHVRLREVDCKEGGVPKNECLQTVVLEKTPESSLGSKEINPEYSLERLMLKLQYLGHLMWTNDSLESPWCWERLRAEGEEGIRGWRGWMMSPMQWTRTWANFGSLEREGGLVWCGHEDAQSQKFCVTEQQHCHGYSLFII